MKSSSFKCASIVLLVASVGCGGTTEPTVEPVAASTCPAGAQEIERGIAFREIVESGQRIWLYVPCAAEHRGLVVVPPAGSNLLTGMALAEGDRPEHLPYARAGYVVVSFDIAGPLQSESDEAFFQAVVTFMRDEAGMTSARNAIQRALTEVPSIDSGQIYAAGHSSAATLVLLLAATDDRVRAVIAHAPVTDVEGRFAEAIPDFEMAIPSYGTFLRQISPIQHAGELAQKPVFLFHALDDRAVAPRESEALFEAMQPRHPHTRRVTTRGDHYQPMLDEGIPQAIEWLATLP